MVEFNKKSLEKLAELARLDLNPDEEEKLLKDLRKILDYFGELQELDTARVEPMAGGTDSKNIVREDQLTTDDTGKGREAFPEEQSGYLKVPPVF